MSELKDSSVTLIHKVAVLRGFTFFSILLTSALLFPLADERSDTTSYSNADLLSRANRSFSMRNFLASERYYRELDRRLALLLSQQQPSDALQQIEIDEELILAPFGLGHTLIFLHKYNEAAQQLEKGLKLYPEWATSHVEMEFFKDPNFTGPVVNDLQEKVDTSSDAISLLCLGYIQFFNEDFRRAKDSFSKALKVDQNSSMATYFLEKISLASRHETENLLPLDRLQNRREIGSEELISYGNTSFKNSEYAQAARFYEKAIELNQDIPEAHIAYGDSLFALGRFEEATRAIVKGLQIDPYYPERPLNRRDFYRNPKEFDLQLETLEGYVHSHPSDLDARFLLGYNYFFIQDYDRANKQFQAVLISKTLNSPAQLLRRMIRQHNTTKIKKPL